MEQTSITRSRARYWLGRTVTQRSVRRKAVEAIRSDMDAGRWEPDVAPPILIDRETGAVIDGQHRLRAYLATEPSFRLMAEVREVDSAHLVVVDTGTPRNLADTLAALGYENTKQLSALFGTAIYWATGSGGATDWSRSRQADWIKANPNAIDAAKQAASVPGGGLIHIPAGTVGCLYDIAEYAEGGPTAMEFVGALRKGELNYSPANRLIELYQDGKNPNSKTNLHSRQLSLLVARVYMGWLNDETLRRLYARRRSLTELPGWNDWVDVNWKSS